MTRSALGEYEQLIEAAYRAPRGPDGDSHSLLGNLETVPPEAWDWAPPGGKRTIREIVEHAGGCKYMYDNKAFRDGTYEWGKPPADPDGWQEMPITSLLAWLDEGHVLLMESVARLDDDEALDRPARAPWGALESVRWVLRVMIQHDHYHAGEVNHIRSLFEQADGWAWAEDE